MERNFRPSGNLNSNNSSQRQKTWKFINAMNPKGNRKQTIAISIISYLIEIIIRQDRKLLLDGLQESNSNVKTIVCIMSKLSRIPHRSKWTASFWLDIKSSSRMPSATTKLASINIYIRRNDHSKIWRQASRVFCGCLNATLIDNFYERAS